MNTSTGPAASLRDVSLRLPRPRFFFSQAEDGIRCHCVTGVQTCALPICACFTLADDDFYNPPKIVVGERETRTGEVLCQLYSGIDAPQIGRASCRERG